MKKSTIAICIVCAIAVICIYPELALASGDDVGIEELSTPMNKLKNTITGPVAFGLAIIGFVIGGGSLVFNPELGSFGRTGIFLILAVSIILGAVNIASSVFGATAALM